MGPNTKKVRDVYFRLLGALGPEFEVLMNVPVGEVEKVAGPMVAEGLRRVRQGRVKIRPGYDGLYGKVSIFSEPEVSEIKGQGSLF